MTFTQLKTVSDLPAMVDVLGSDDWSRDIVETSQELLRRDATGLLRGPENTIIAFRNKDVRALAANPDVGNMPADILFWVATSRDLPAEPDAEPDPVQTDGFRQFLNNQVFTANPPLHSQSRNILARQLMPRNIRRFTSDAERLAKELVDETIGRGPIDFSHEFAGRFVTRFWAEQLGLTRDEAAEVQKLTEEMNLTFLLARTPEQSRTLYSAVTTYMDVVGNAVRRAWASGNNALLSEMETELAEIELEGKPADIGRLVAANFFDGFHTVGIAIVNVIFRLLADDTTHEQVRASPAQVTNAFYEGTRLESPLTLTQRLALRDLVYEGVLIPAGSPIGMIWAAANRDPEVFADADSYQLTRPMQNGTTFGGGAHLCPGRNVARMLTEIAVTALTAPDVRIAPVGSDHGWVPHSIVRHLTELPVTIQPVDRR